jgi:hypothetical protein
LYRTPQTLKYLMVMYEREFTAFRERLLRQPAVQAALAARKGDGPASVSDIDDTSFLPGEQRGRVGQWGGAATWRVAPAVLRAPA